MHPAFTLHAALTASALCRFLLLAGLFTSGLAGANTTTPDKAPEQIPGVTRVEAEELLSLVEREPRLVIIDSRIRMDRRQGYIEGSVSLPDTETTCTTLQQSLGSRERPVLFYCNGVKCGRSGNAAQIARQCGHSRIHWYRGGFEDWKQKNYPFLKQ